MPRLSDIVKDYEPTLKVDLPDPSLPKFNDPQEAFNNAIREGKLSEDETAENWAGHFMYMGTDPKRGDLFKHRDTRQYLDHTSV
jgi:hypothetical protein